MAWRLAAVLLFLTGTACPASIVVKCYDGSSSARVRSPASRRAFRLGICDLDRQIDGRCHFRVALSATGGRSTRVFNVTLHIGHRRYVQFGDTTVLFNCHRGPEPPPPPPPPVLPPPGALTFTCQDAVLAESSTDPVCDVDQACDGICTFGFFCPPCCGCAAPCCESGPCYHIEVSVGERYVLPACELDRQPARVLDCQPMPAGFVCPTTTTTTLPLGSCLTDADCGAFLPECHHCELGNCEGLPIINPNGSITNIVCPIPR